MGNEDRQRNVFGKRIARRVLGFAARVLGVDEPQTTAQTDPFERVQRALRESDLITALEALESVARSMGDESAEAWANLELRGYLDDPRPDIPTYRRRFSGEMHIPGVPPKREFLAV